MALRKKKRFDRPVRCSQCKEKRAYHTMHGGLINGGGKTICDDCFPAVQQEELRLIEQVRNYEPSEAEYQLGVDWNG